MRKVGNPIPIFFDARQVPLDGGHIYVGAAHADPEIDPIPVYSDEALTVELSQPIRTLGGLAVDGVIPVSMFVASDDYSQRVTDVNGAQLSYSPSVFTDVDTVQPASPILDALVANGTPTTWGLSLLLLANYAAFKAANSIPDYLALTGGTMSGDITRQGAGRYTYWNDPALTSGRQFLTASGDGDPTSLPGDVWFKKVAT